MTKPSIEETIQYIKDTNRLEGHELPDYVEEALRSDNPRKVIDQIAKDRPWRKEAP